MSKRKRRQSAGGKRKGSTKKKKETQEKASGTVNEESAACGQQAELRCEDDRAAPSSAEERGVAGSRSESEGGDGAHKLSPGVKDCFLTLAQNILPGRSSTAGTSCDDDDEDDDDDVAQPSAPEHTTSDQHRGAGEGPAQGDATLHSYGGAHGPNHKASTSGEQRQEADPERQQPTVTEQGGADEGGQEHLPHSAVYVNPCVLEERDWESRFAVLEMEDSSDAGAGQRKAKGVVRSRRCKPATSAAAAAAAGKREVTTALVCAETACPDLTHTEAEGSLQGAAGAGGQTDPASAAQDREEGGPHPCTPAAARGSPESQREDAGGTQSCEDHSEWDSEFLLDCSTQTHRQPQGPVTPLETHCQPEGPVTPLETHRQPQGPVTPLETHCQPQGPVTPLETHRPPQGPVTLLKTHHQPQGPVSPLETHRQPQGPVTLLETHRQPEGPVTPLETHRQPQGPVTPLETHCQPQGPVTPLETHRQPQGPVTPLETHRQPQGPVTLLETHHQPQGPVTPLETHRPPQGPVTLLETHCQSRAVKLQSSRFSFQLERLSFTSFF
ncbi:UNVERIFIED_CONTAM: hypothetical protein FKN15_021390 [Acipenser sinensis]